MYGRMPRSSSRDCESATASEKPITAAEQEAGERLLAR